MTASSTSTLDPASGPAFDIVSVKGFGDLVIALTCLQRVLPASRSRVGLLLGQHLRPLYDALDPPFSATAFNHGDAGPAALFQLRSRPVRDVLRSALALRRGLGEVRDPHRTLVFDKYDVRHRFLAPGRTACALPTGANLYEAWDRFLTAHGLAPAAAVAPPARPAGRRLHVFPGAREEERRFPVKLLRALVTRATAAGLTATIFSVAGEMPHLAETNLPVEEIPRDFARTLAAVSGADRIISADSMTAHMAEHCRIPVYVLAPREKYFWLPLSAARSGRHGLFADDLDAGTLADFLR